MEYPDQGGGGGRSRGGYRGRNYWTSRLKVGKPAHQTANATRDWEDTTPTTPNPHTFGTPVTPNQRNLLNQPPTYEDLQQRVLTIEGQLVLAQTDSAYFAQEFTRLNNEVAQIKAAAAQKEQEDAATIKSSKIREEQSWKEVMAAKAELDSHEKSSGIELEKMRNQANKVITELRKDIKAHADPDDESCEKGLKAVHDEAVKDAKDLKVKAQAAEDRLVILGTNHELELKVTRDESEKTIAVLQDNLQMAEAKLESMVSNHDTKLKDVREESSKTITELRNNLHAADDALNTMRVSNRKIIINLRGEVTDLEGQVQSSKTDLKNIFASNELELKAMREKTDGLEKDLQDAESVNNDLSTQAANDINAALSAHDSARQEIETQAAEITMLRDKTVKLENWSKRLDDSMFNAISRLTVLDPKYGAQQ